MCAHCEGHSEQAVLDWYRDTICQVGVAVAEVPPQGDRPGFSYTIGLTRHHGHPELLVTGLAPGGGQAMLSVLADTVRSGTRFLADHVYHTTGSGLELLLVRVAEPGQLAHAQAIYGTPRAPVTALQVVWSDSHGHWPWQPEWPPSLNQQHLFGVPLHR